MKRITAWPTAPATATAPELALRPWRLEDSAALVDLYRDEALRHWTSVALDDETGADHWVREQQRGWSEGNRFGFAVVEAREGEGAGAEVAEGRPLGHVVRKGISPDSPSAEVGYWTAAPARGRGVAPRALHALTDWAFATFATDGLTRLELLHQVDNTASCRVAQKCGYDLSAHLPASPPAFPLDGHVHVRVRAD
ncbi:GNAT family N-acetyltransferase [Streptomyces pseudovenezuelae]|uniref:RimJ/RimL family protein N-acetyltransferase n=1 Tax=Streptomyces pseudovenezuelae TaxID=67350 RepID=A0ABT6LAS0_9ACTN|nr:GNAT family N-acetyltransferase [Streptomyces pseudovenezuelae]MDH6213408.1 RimJ/RimL family protein N-acetyltransferase [Streptomyces pseudovenezuelae]